MKLYKYMSWKPFDEENNLIDNYYARDNLINSQLYFSSAKDFNDPFDLSPGLEITGTDKELSDRGIQTAITKEGRQVGIDKMYELLYKVGVCCFTLNCPEQVLMWSHYGDQHRGICLCFEIPDNVLASLPDLFDFRYRVSRPWKVYYSNKLPTADPTKLTIPHLETILKTKSEEWAYEKEHRIICFDFVGPITYDSILLKSIVVGCKMEKRKLDELKKVIKQLPQALQLQIARKNDKDFGLNITNI